MVREYRLLHRELYGLQRVNRRLAWVNVLLSWLLVLAVGVIVFLLWF